MYCCKLTSVIGGLLTLAYYAGVLLENYEQISLRTQMKIGIEKTTIIIIEPTVRPELLSSVVEQLLGIVILYFNSQHTL